MATARPIRASSACVSSIISYLPAQLSKKAHIEARPDGVSDLPSGNALTGINSQGNDKVGRDEQLPNDASGHAPSNGLIRLGESIKIILHKALPVKEDCAACTRQVRPARVNVAPCGHKYCSRCLRKMARMALQNKMVFFPVRCCSKEIPPHQVTSVMNAQARRLYAARVAEHALPPAERWYCPHTKCGGWIAPRYIKRNSQLQKCPHCRTRICSGCRDLVHAQRECAHDPELDQVLDVARRHRWQRCPDCHILVMRTDGCKHMTCRCGAEFCYLCGRHYPGCNCRNSTGLTDNDRIPGGDLDVATIVTAMEIAEREEAELVPDGATEAIDRVLSAPTQPRASQSMAQPREWPVRQPRAQASTRVNIPPRPVPVSYTPPRSRSLIDESGFDLDAYTRPMRLVNRQLRTARERSSNLIMLPRSPGPLTGVRPV